MSDARPIGGAVAGLGAAVLFGLSTPIAKLLVPSTGPFLIAGLLYLGAGIGLSLVAPLRRAGLEAKLQRKDLPPLAGMVLAGGMAGPLLLFLGLARLPGFQASLLLNLEAPLTIGLAVLVFGESLSMREVFGAAVVVLGGSALSAGLGGGPAQFWGSLAIVGACASWALDNNLGQRLAVRDPVAVTRVKALVAGAVNSGLGLSLGERLPSAAALGAMLATGFFGYGLSIVLHLLAMRHVGAARQAAYFATAPFIAALASIPILGERLGAVELGADGLMVTGMVLLLRARHDHRHEHEALEHDHSHVHDGHHSHEHQELLVEPHAHSHSHVPLAHDHPHLPDAHHRHRH
jgi:drug/metabolite transporter (DMT)-like permease